MKKPSKYLIVIAGPTAVGKSDLALFLAEWLSTEIISADSRQIFRQMNIGTAKPEPHDLQRVRHHFINELDINQSFTASAFEEEALCRIESIFQKKQVAIMCGGTGLYINAVTHGLDQIPDVGMEIREKYDQQYRDEGIESLQILLKNLDLEYAEKVDLSNHRRLIRALSVIEATGEKFSSFLSRKPKTRPFKSINILLTEDRQVLYQRIDQRVDQMIGNGLEDEVYQLLAFQDLQALQTVGYQEWFPYFTGSRKFEEVIRLIKRNSRRYAKRQSTWFRKYGKWEPFSNREYANIQAYVSKQIASPTQNT
ncbi:MAG: tRNA (adenosine(37)-N6)-dimethylallyltransferase MiaA [Saprospiraceae bacterium]|nr:tRNA (adenosine(37)-N6)-dimethylallyltransferase MiaA [Saprospiraceae bacterium]